MFLDAKCNAFWASFLESLDASDPRRAAMPDAFGFGGQGAIAEELAALVLAGNKRATASLPAEYTCFSEAIPRTGDLSIILDGVGNPVAIIERIFVEVVPFAMVSAEFAAREGKGDGSLENWRKAHSRYFGQVRVRLGGQLERDTPVLCQSFKVVWPPSASDAAAA